jgi:hypothetical protein
VPGSADKDALKQHGGQQAVFIPCWDIVSNVHGSDKRNLAHGARTQTQLLRRQVCERQLCRAQGATPWSSVIQDFEAAFAAVLVEDRSVAAGIELQKDLARTSTGEMDGHDQPAREWQYVIRVLRADERDALPAHFVAHASRCVKTEHLVSVSMSMSK